MSRRFRFIAASLLVGLHIWTPEQGNEWLRRRAEQENA